MNKSPYDTDLDRNPANFQPLTPLTLLERAASTFPDQVAIIHGPLRRTYAEFYARARQLASALDRRGIKRGDTVSVVLANTPAMLECHYGIAGVMASTTETVSPRHRLGRARQYAGDAGMPLRRADDPGRAQHHQHTPRR